jgi:hypothetical protein
VSQDGDLSVGGGERRLMSRVERVGGEEGLMEGLMEIHRVLYRGGSGRKGIKEDAEEVKRVLEKWFEGDCGMYSRLSERSFWYMLIR